MRPKLLQQRRPVRWLLLLGALLAVGCATRLLNPLPSLKDDVSLSLSAGWIRRCGARSIGNDTPTRPSGCNHNVAPARLPREFTSLAELPARWICNTYLALGSTGTLVYDEVRIAADRGVRVRLLLDDNSTSDLDPILATLDAHPNIEVRCSIPYA